MKTNKHTPGPWVVEVHDKETTVESKYQTICTNVSNCDADIIAAAPEMLAALEAVQGLCDNHPEIRQQVQSVIAKAKGE